MHIKTTMRYHITPVKMTIIKKPQITNVGEDVKERENLCTIGENRSTLQSNLATSSQVEGANISFRRTFREIYTYTQEFSEEPHF